MLQGKTILVGVTGGIAAYKTCELVSRLKKQGAAVHVLMTKSAQEFVSPLTFATLSQNRVVTDMFSTDFDYSVQHISLAKAADFIVIAPGTANTLAKLALGLADDMLTTTALASSARLLVCPAMNTGMYNNPAFLQNLNTLISRGAAVLEPDDGLLACGDVGKGRMAEPERIEREIISLLSGKRDLEGKTVLITAGATEEPIDPVRSITNRSSGKMGAALCTRAMQRGANVILVAGVTTVPMPNCETVRVKTTQQMLEATLKALPRADIIIKAAAPADYRVKSRAEQKLKDSALKLELVKNPDIAKECGKIKESRKLVIFSAETENLIKNAKEKLESKNADLAVANDVTQPGAGFESDTNAVTVIDRQGHIIQSGIRSKLDIADFIFDRIAGL